MKNKYYYIICIVLFLIIVYIVINYIPENYAWSCTFIPNKNYYKEDWILGDNQMSDRIAALAIKQY